MSIARPTLRRARTRLAHNGGLSRAGGSRQRHARTSVAVLETLVGRDINAFTSDSSVVEQLIIAFYYSEQESASINSGLEPFFNSANGNPYFFIACHLLSIRTLCVFSSSTLLIFLNFILIT